MFGADVGIVLAYSAGIMLIFMLAWLLVVPLKVVGKFVVNALIGGIFILVYNYFGQTLMWPMLGINYVTAAIVGFLGVPGFIALVIINFIL